MLGMLIIASLQYVMRKFTLMGNITLRPYQEGAIKDLSDSFRKKNKWVIFCLPTGAGGIGSGAPQVERAPAGDPGQGR